VTSMTAAQFIDILRAQQGNVSNGLFRGRTPEQSRAEIAASVRHAPLLEEIRAEATRHLDQPIPELTYTLFRQYRETGSRSEYDRVYFERRKRLTTLAIAAWLEPEHEGCATGLHDVLWSILNEYTWCLTAHLPQDGDPIHIDLFAAETAFALSEILALMGDRLPEELASRIRAETDRRVLRPFLLRNERFDWETAEHNWASVCGGSVGAAALYLLEDEDELAQVLERALSAMTHYVRGFGNDGVCLEGYLYWQYGFGYYVYFADLVKQRTCGAVDLFAAEKVHQIALFEQKSFLHGRRIVNFSDALPESGLFLGLSHYLSRIYPDGFVPEDTMRAAYRDDHCGRWAPAIRNLLWVDGQSVSDGQPWPADAYAMPEAQWYVCRTEADTASGSNRACAWAAKGGHNGEPHNHNDIGHFMLCAGDTSLLVDLGSGLYTRDYFGPNRYSILCNSSAGHSVPIVNGQHQRAGADARAQVIEASTREGEVRFAVEMSAAYEVESLRGLERRFAWHEAERCLELTDSYTCEGPLDSFVERFMTMVEPAGLGEGCVRIAADGEGARVDIVYDASRFDWAVQTLVHVDHFGREVACYAVDFALRAPERAGTVAFRFLIG
jgi:hypothetical protein